ncbi:MAG TPA: cation:proton antiporter [Burkholderiales bacterium]|nr:cation:proton antiporter [Burkholderiales bacterium]
MNTYLFLIVFCLILIGSFFFNYLQKKLHISAVILLLLSGVILQLALPMLSISDAYLKIFGTLGLLIIVLEAVVDLEVHGHNYKMFLMALCVSIVIVVLTSALIAWGFMLAYNLSLHAAVIYAIPLSIVSSAIVIPSLSNLEGVTKEFLILESIFSDIIGVLLFNFLISSNEIDLVNISKFSMNFTFMLIISLITTIILGIALSRDKIKNLHILILAVLILTYSIAKWFHLSALLLILIFGVFLRNLPMILNTRFGMRCLGNYLNHVTIHKNLHSMRDLIEDLGFIVRSIFFVLLGYSIKLSSLISLKVILLGFMVVVITYAIRWAILHRSFTSNVVLATTMAPRGLITVLLFFQIPNELQSQLFDEGITFFVVIASTLIMSGGLFYHRYTKKNLKANP